MAGVALHPHLDRLAELNASKGMLLGLERVAAAAKALDSPQDRMKVGRRRTRCRCSCHPSWRGPPFSLSYS